MSRERPQLKKKTLMRKLEKKSRNLFKLLLLGCQTFIAGDAKGKIFKCQYCICKCPRNVRCGCECTKHPYWKCKNKPVKADKRKDEENDKDKEAIPAKKSYLSHVSGSLSGKTFMTKMQEESQTSSLDSLKNYLFFGDGFQDKISSKDQDLNFSNNCNRTSNDRIFSIKQDLSLIANPWISTKKSTL